MTPRQRNAGMEAKIIQISDNMKTGIHNARIDISAGKIHFTEYLPGFKYSNLHGIIAAFEKRSGPADKVSVVEFSTSVNR